MDQLRPRASVLTGYAALLLTGCAAFLLGGCAGLLLTGCAAGAGQQASQTTGHVTARPGHVTGRLLMEGGPLRPGGQQPGQRPMPGTVTFTAEDHSRVAVRVGPSGAFSVPLPPGRYRIEGRSPDVTEADGGSTREPPCSQPLSATVTAGHTVTVSVVCVVP